MFRSILSAVGRALARTARTAAEIAMAPMHAVLIYLFPSLYEPLPGDCIECEANDGSLPFDLGFDPFANAEETKHARDLETERVLAWAADAAYSGAEVPLPDVRPDVRAWLASLSSNESEALVLAGKNAIHGHLHYSIEIPGMPRIHEKGRRHSEPTASLPWDPTIATGEFLAIAARTG